MARKKKKAKRKNNLTMTGKPIAKKGPSPRYTDSYTFRYYGNMNESRICSKEDCNTQLSIYNKFDICNACRQKGIQEILDSPRDDKPIDIITDFDKQHKVKAVGQMSVDQYLPHSLEVSNIKRQE